MSEKKEIPYIIQSENPHLSIKIEEVVPGAMKTKEIQINVSGENSKIARSNLEFALRKIKELSE